MSVTTATPIVTHSTRGRAVLTYVIAAVIAVAVSSLLAVVALLLGANPSFPPLAVYVYAPFVILGLAAASVGWRIVRRRAEHPAAVLKVLVPILTVLSFIPDTVLAITGFIPDASLIAVIALACMHLVVVGAAVVANARLAPVR